MPAMFTLKISRKGIPARHIVANRAPEYRIVEPNGGPYAPAGLSEMRDALADGTFLAAVLDADAER